MNEVVKTNKSENQVIQRMKMNSLGHMQFQDSLATQKAGICILCTNLSFLKVLMDNLPAEIYASKTPIAICVEKRAPDAPPIHAVKEHISLELKATVFSSIDVLRYMSEPLNLGEFDELDEKHYYIKYRMGMNILLQAYMFRRYPSIKGWLFLDDDIILSQGLVSNVLNSTHSMLFGFKLGQAISEHMFETMSNVTKYPYSLQDSQDEWRKFYGENMICSCARFLHQNDFDASKRYLYESLLNRFFRSKRLKQYWLDWEATNYTLKKAHAFYQDQIFEAMAYVSIGLSNESTRCLKSYIRNFMQGFEKFLDTQVGYLTKEGKYKSPLDRPIWHNGSNSHKQAYYNWMSQNGFIRNMRHTMEAKAKPKIRKVQA